MPDQAAIDAVRSAARSLRSDTDLDAVLAEIGDAPIVLLGEATHGTHEFYRIRAELSRRLIVDKGFDAIAVEADWPDALRVSRHVRGSGEDRSARDALGNFQRFPLWMWRNAEVLDLVDWLRRHNQRQERREDRVGFYGLDLYSLRSSMEAVVRYLSQADPEAARQARARYSCFDHLAEDPQRYGYAATFGMKKDCEEEVVRQLVALSENAARLAQLDGAGAADELFYAQQNARVAVNAEAYYRAMFTGRDESWNLRDTHMADTLDALRAHLAQQKGRPAKVVVWAHNSHLGDARATEMGDHGQLNLGQLVRERHGDEGPFLLGFTTHAGTVTAASEWDSPAELKTVRPSRPDSIERLFHDAGAGGDVFLPMRGNDALRRVLGERRLERAIGVLYLPESERLSHYFHADIASQFDAVIHVDTTRALHPLDSSPGWRHDEAPETYPTGI